MWRQYYFVFACTIIFSLDTTLIQATYDKDFMVIPKEFLLGAGTSAGQIEGEWNKSGKSVSSLDWLIREHPKLYPVVNDISSDSYHKYKQDVKILKYIGMDYYSFSMSWSRLLPNGYPDKVNIDGVRYYHSVLDELEKNGIKPIVTLHHFDHPQLLEKKFDGWHNELMIDAFAQYARFVFEEFGHRVKIFLTINEPSSMCDNLLLGRMFMDTPNDWIRKYRCAHNILKAHATTYHIYDKEFRPKLNGIIGINLQCQHYQPKYANDSLSAEVIFQFTCGWFAHPIFTRKGDYPEIMKRIILNNSLSEGRNSSRLPVFSKQWIDYIRGSSDFFGLNYYVSFLTEFSSSVRSDSHVLVSYNSSWEQASNGFSVVPRDIRRVLRKIKREYNNPSVFITENGYADIGYINDNGRIKFIHSFLKEILLAVKYDECNVKAYTYWSLIDGFEFFDGYDAHFGLAYVDYNSPNRTRILKDSAHWYRNIVRNRALPIDL